MKKTNKKLKAVVESVEPVKKDNVKLKGVEEISQLSPFQILEANKIICLEVAGQNNDGNDISGIEQYSKLWPMQLRITELLCAGVTKITVTVVERQV